MYTLLSNLLVINCLQMSFYFVFGNYLQGDSEFCVFSLVRVRLCSPFASLFHKLALRMQSSLTVNRQCAVSHGGHVVLQIMFILPYWSTKFLPSHNGDTQRDFKKMGRKILALSLLQKYLKLLPALGSVNTTCKNAILRKLKGITLKSITKSRVFIQLPMDGFSYICLLLLY